ncbi:MAG: hypothetical protein QM723_35840 [Myxococcaceae bacterium]
MHPTLRIAALLLLAAAPRYAVKGEVDETYSYCGGAVPPDELLRNLAKPVPVKARAFDVYRGETAEAETFTTFTTGDDGKYSVSLPDGKWCVIEATRRVRPGVPPEAGADAACWKAESKRCDLRFEVSGKELSVPAATLRRGCSFNPTCGPHGPPPP